MFFLFYNKIPVHFKGLLSYNHYVLSCIICVDVAIQCSKIKSVSNGIIIGLDRKVGSIVNFTCHSGYTLYGPATINCTNKGVWTGTTPSCISM